MWRFLAITAGLPLAAVVGNALFRLAARLQQSASADLILVLVVFDLTILIEGSELEKAFPEARLVYGFVALGCFFLYGGAIVGVEPALRKWMASKPRRGYPFLLMFISLSMSAVALFLNLVPLAWRSLT